jgi:hypothetical protein
LFDAAPADAGIPVVEVDGRVAMTANEATLVAEAKALVPPEMPSRPSSPGRRAPSLMSRLAECARLDRVECRKD